MKRFIWGKVIIFVAIFFVANAPFGFAQKEQKVKLKVGKDEIPVVDLMPVSIEGKALSKKERKAYMERVRDYERLRAYIKKVLPIAKDCGRLINEVNAELARLDKNADRSRYMKRLEKDLFKKYEPVFRSMTVSQGKLLIKLIYRETNNSAYELIEEYKSWSAAAFWQLIAKFFGTNLKDDYDPQKEVVIESIIKEIESGKSDDYVIVYDKQ